MRAIKTPLGGGVGLVSAARVRAVVVCDMLGSTVAHTLVLIDVYLFVGEVPIQIVCTHI